MMRSEHCNHMLYQFFKAKSLKLEAKLRLREEELTAAETVIADRDREICELKSLLKAKEQQGKEEEKLRNDLAMVRSELEEAKKNSSAVTGLIICSLPCCCPLL